MKVIWKYPVVSGHFSLHMPRGARILCVQEQRDAVVLWAETEVGAPPETRRFTLLSTGETFQFDGAYLGTIQTLDGEFVFHLYERTDNGA